MNGTPGLVSVVITTHYRNEWLGGAIESALAQTHPAVEVFVVDDSGERFAEPVVEEYDVTYLAHERNRGDNEARTTGLASARGEYVQFLDDDDRMRPAKLARQVAVFETHPEVGVVGCGVDTGDEVVLPPSSHRGDVLREALTLRMFPCVTSTMLLRRSVLEAVLPLRQRPARSDVAWRIDLALRTEFDYVPAVLLDRRVHDANRGASLVGREEDLRLLAEYADCYDRFEPAFEHSVRHRLYRAYAEHLLGDEGGSWQATRLAALACYHGLRAGELSLGSFGLAAVSPLGRRGYRALQPVYTALVAGGDRGRRPTAQRL
jgi:glycosyltransferase involved in cell wall biosynthesis